MAFRGVVSIHAFILPFALLILLAGSAGCQGAGEGRPPPPTAKYDPHQLSGANNISPVTAERGWLMSGGGRWDYRVILDRSAPLKGDPTILLTAKDKAQASSYGTWMRVVDASKYVGCEVAITAHVRCSGADKRADFWARVQARNSPGDGPGMGGDGEDVRKLGDWKDLELSLKVRQGAWQVQYGVGLVGQGKVWLSEPKLQASNCQRAPQN